MTPEGARVAEGVKYAPPAGVRGHEHVIVALVEVEPGLLAATDRDREPAGCLRHHEFFRAWQADPATMRLESFDACRGRVIEPVERPVREQLFERAVHEANRLRHAEREALHHA